MNNLSNLLNDRAARDDLRNKVEVVMAVITLVGFVYKQYRKRQDGYVDITSFGQE